MSGVTHAMVGANAIWITVLVGTADERFWIFLVAGALAGLLPDVDATQALIHRYSYGVSRVFSFFRHRGPLHSLLAVFGIFILATLFLTQFHPWLPAVVTLGYLSHPLIDGFNGPGVEYLYPSRRRYRIVPRWLTSPVGGWMDQLLLVVSIAALAYFLFTQVGTSAIAPFFEAL